MLIHMGCISIYFYLIVLLVINFVLTTNNHISSSVQQKDGINRVVNKLTGCMSSVP